MIEYKVKVYEDQTIWYLNGKYHREDGPAIESVDGDNFWFLNGKRHRVDGPAIEYQNGGKAWFINDQRHREDGPAVELEAGYKSWFLNGKRHREDGPAVECADGYKEWWINGKELTEDEFTLRTNPVKKMTVTEIEAALGHKVEVIAPSIYISDASHTKLDTLNVKMNANYSMLSEFAKVNCNTMFDRDVF